jgi:tRNA-Thr(GGU) m(6)t(6)A37 methyltransferase TsaA
MEPAVTVSAMQPGPGGQDTGPDMAYSVRPVGVIWTPYDRKSTCPRWPWTQPAISRITLYQPFCPAAAGLATGMRVYMLWWAGQADRSTIARRPAEGQARQGVFTSRGPDRPNPIGLTLAVIVAADLPSLLVRGADCVDGTPLLDLKPALAADGTLWQ